MNPQPDVDHVLETYRIGLSGDGCDADANDEYRKRVHSIYGVLGLAQHVHSISREGLRVLVDTYWARCARLAEYQTLHPYYGDAERAKLPVDCTTMRLGHFRFSDNSFADADGHLLLTIVERVHDDDDASAVVASAVQAGIDEETFYFVLNHMSLSWSKYNSGMTQSYEQLYPLLNLVHHYPVILGQSAELTLACVHLAMEHMESKPAFYMAALAAAAALSPEVFETQAVIDALTDPRCPTTHRFGVTVLGKLRPRVLQRLGAGARLAKTVQLAVQSKRRTATLERLIARIEAPENLVMQDELAAAMG